MTIQQLEYFLSCASLLSFNKAAKVHYTSPSTITRQIASLEHELGVPLFIRDTHKVTVTEEGKMLFLRVHTIIGEVSQYRDSLIDIGKLPPETQPYFRISSYTSDSMYRILVDILQAFPSDWLSKPYQFIFPKEGEMMNTILDGVAHVGIESAEHLKKYEDRFDTKLLHRSPFHLLVGQKHPLYGKSSISIEELIARFDNYGDFIPIGAGALAYSQMKIRSAEDLRVLGEFTISQLPQIIPLLGRAGRITAPMDNMMLLLPRELELFDFVHFHPVKLKGDVPTTDYVLFWKKENTDPDLPRFLDMIDYSGTAPSNAKRMQSS